MLAGDEKAAMNIHEEANRLAMKLNGGDLAILGGPVFSQCCGARQAANAFHAIADELIAGAKKRTVKLALGSVEMNSGSTNDYFVNCSLGCTPNSNDSKSICSCR
jgi:hypothetical protein